jgi:CheY-like chemotaxis protein
MNVDDDDGVTAQVRTPHLSLIGHDIDRKCVILQNGANRCSYGRVRFDQQNSMHTSLSIRSHASVLSEVMKRLLLCHPSEALRENVEAMLARIGVGLDTVRSVDEALACIREDAHALLLVDRVLAGPRLDEIIETVRSRPVRPVFIVTSTDDPDLDPNVVSLIVPAFYDVATLVGVILACATEGPGSVPEALGPQLAC